jgi:hypothetical protein
VQPSEVLSVLESSDLEARAFAFASRGQDSLAWNLCNLPGSVYVPVNSFTLKLTNINGPG